MELTLEQVAFQMILNSGNARSLVMEALGAYKENDVEQYNSYMAEAEIALKEAHSVHFSLIQQEASGEKIELNLLMLHAEDHLMSTQTMKDLSKELIGVIDSKIIK